MESREKENLFSIKRSLKKVKQTEAAILQEASEAHTSHEPTLSGTHSLRSSSEREIN